MKFMTTFFTIIFIISCTGTQPTIIEQIKTGKIVVGYSDYGTETEWRQAHVDSIKKAAEDAGFELVFYNASERLELQIKAIRSFIDLKVDVIAFSPVDASLLEPVLREAKAAHIPVICIDRPVSVDDASLYLTCIKNDWFSEGKMAGQWLIEYLSKHGMMSREIHIAEIQGITASEPQIQRGNGFREIISRYPNIKIILSSSGDFIGEKGKQVMEAFLQEEGENIDVVYAHNDGMAIGAIQAIEEYGLKPGKDIIIVSIDAVRDTFEALISGKLNCTIECSPDVGPQLMETVKAVLAGEDVPKFIGIKDNIFTQENAEAELPNRKY